MDTRDGRIYSPSEAAELLKRDPMAQIFLKRMALSPTGRQMRRRPARVGRNEPCPCGSRKKFKKCCLRA